MKRRRAVLAVMAILGVVLAVSATGASSSGQKKAYKVAFVELGSGIPSLIDIDKGVVEFFRRNGTTVNIFSGELSGAKQSQLIKRLASQGYDGIMTIPADAKALTTALNDAKRRGVPVVCLYNRCDNSTANSGTNEAAAGRNMALYSAQLLKQRYGTIRGKVFVEGQSRNFGVEKFRVGNFVTTIKKYPNVQVVDYQYTDQTPAKAQTILQGWLTKYPTGIDLVYSGSDTTLVPAITVAQRAGRVCNVAQKSWKTNPACIIFTSVDGGPLGLESIKKGDLSGDALFLLTFQGYHHAALMYDVLTGKAKAGAERTLEPSVVDGTNVDCVTKVTNAMNKGTKSFNFTGTVAQVLRRNGCKTPAILEGLPPITGQKF